MKNVKKIRFVRCMLAVLAHLRMTSDCGKLLRKLWATASYTDDNWFFMFSVTFFSSAQHGDGLVLLWPIIGKWEFNTQ